MLYFTYILVIVYSSYVGEPKEWNRIVMLY